MKKSSACISAGGMGAKRPMGHSTISMRMSPCRVMETRGLLKNSRKYVKSGRRARRRRKLKGRRKKSANARLPPPPLLRKARRIPPSPTVPNQPPHIRVRGPFSSRRLATVLLSTLPLLRRACSSPFPSTRALLTSTPATRPLRTVKHLSQCITSTTAAKTTTRGRRLCDGVEQVMTMAQCHHGAECSRYSWRHVYTSCRRAGRKEAPIWLYFDFCGAFTQAADNFRGRLTRIGGLGWYRQVWSERSIYKVMAVSEHWVEGVCCGSCVVVFGNLPALMLSYQNCILSGRVARPLFHFSVVEEIPRGWRMLGWRMCGVVCVLIEFSLIVYVYISILLFPAHQIKLRAGGVLRVCFARL